MKTINQKDLTIAIKLHALWVHGVANGVRLNLSGYTLVDNNFRGCDLRGADLSNCIMIASSLTLANLSDTFMKGVRIVGRPSNVNLKGAYISGSPFAQGI